MATILRRAKHAGRVARMSTIRELPQPPTPEPPLTIVVRPEVLRSIAFFAGAAPGRETAGPLIGTVQRSWEVGGDRLIVSVLATLPPGPVLRAGQAHVSLGQGGDGERAASALRWWRAVTGLALRHLGDWHKHHSGMSEPSPGDDASAKRMRSDASSPVWLTAVVVGQIRQDEKAKSEGNLIRFARSWESDQQVRLYRATTRGLEPVKVRTEAAAIPRLPALPWHVRDPVRFAAECRLLHEAGYRVAVEPWTGGQPGLVLQVREDGSPPLTVITGPHYPVRPPVVVNGRGQSRPVNDWSPARFIVDAVGTQS